MLTRISSLRFLFKSLLVLVVVALAVAACGGGDEDEGPTAAPGPTATPRTTPAPSPTLAPTPPPSAIKRGGTLTIPQFHDLINFDGSNTNIYQTYYILGSFVWNQIVRFDNKKWSDGNIVGDLAASWSATADGKQYTIKLDPKAKWQNIAPLSGRPFTSADVKWYLEKVLDPAFKSGNRPAIRDIQSIETPDAQTVVLNLKDPYYGLMNGLATYTLKMVPREQFEADGDFTKKAIGTGPFTYSSRETGSRVINVANPSYWKTGGDGKALPYIDRVEIIIGGDPATVRAALRTGQMAFQSPDGEDPQNYRQMRQDIPNLTWEIDFRMYAHTIHGNLSEEPFKSNKKLRQALMKSIDQEALRKNAIFEDDAPYEGPITAGMGQYTLPQDEVKKFMTYDPEGAKRLLTEAGFGANNPAKFDLVFILPSAPGTRQERYQQLLPGMMKNAGFDITIWNPTSAAEGFGRVFGGPGKWKLGSTYVGYEGDVFNWFRNFFATGGSRNWQFLSDPELDAKVTQFGQTLDKATQVRLAQEMQRHILDNAYMVPLVIGRMYMPHQNYVKNFRRTWGWGFAGIENVWLDK